MPLFKKSSRALGVGLPVVFRLHEGPTLKRDRLPETKQIELADLGYINAEGIIAAMRVIKPRGGSSRPPYNRISIVTGSDFELPRYADMQGASIWHLEANSTSGTNIEPLGISVEDDITEAAIVLVDKVINANKKTRKESKAKTRDYNGAYLRAAAIDKTTKYAMLTNGESDVTGRRPIGIIKGITEINRVKIFFPSRNSRHSWSGTMHPAYLMACPNAKSPWVLENLVDVHTDMEPVQRKTPTPFQCYRHKRPTPAEINAVTKNWGKA